MIPHLDRTANILNAVGGWVELSAIALLGLLMWGIVRTAMARQAIRLKREFSLQLAERTRLAQELHDTLLQSACAALLHVEMVDVALREDAPLTRSIERALPELQTAIQVLSNLNVEGRAAVQGLRESAERHC